MLQKRTSWSSFGSSWSFKNLLFAPLGPFQIWSLWGPLAGCVCGMWSLRDSSVYFCVLWFGLWYLDARTRDLDVGCWGRRICVVVPLCLLCVAVRHMSLLLSRALVSFSTLYRSFSCASAFLLVYCRSLLCRFWVLCLSLSLSLSLFFRSWTCLSFLLCCLFLILHSSSLLCY